MLWHNSIGLTKQHLGSTQAGPTPRTSSSLGLLASGKAAQLEQEPKPTLNISVPVGSGQRYPNEARDPPQRCDSGDAVELPRDCHVYHHSIEWITLCWWTNRLTMLTLWSGFHVSPDASACSEPSSNTKSSAPCTKVALSANALAEARLSDVTTVYSVTLGIKLSGPEVTPAIVSVCRGTSVDGERHQQYSQWCETDSAACRTFV